MFSLKVSWAFAIELKCLTFLTMFLLVNGSNEQEGFMVILVDPLPYSKYAFWNGIIT